MKFHLAGFALLLVGSASAADQQKLTTFPVGFADRYGFVGFFELEEPTVASKLGMKNLRSGKLKEAFTAFDAGWRQDPRDFASLHGMTQAAQKLGTLPAVVRSLGDVIDRERAKTGSEPLARHFGLWYAVHIARFFETETCDSKARIAEANGLPKNFTIADKLLNPRSFKTRQYSLMYVGALEAGRQLRKARQAAKSVLVADPGFAELKLLQGRMYRTGVVAKYFGGRKMPIHNDEQDNLKEAAKVTLEVVEKRPDLTVAWYEAGISQASFDKELASRLLSEFVKRSRVEDVRTKYAAEVLSRLKQP